MTIFVRVHGACHDGAARDAVAAPLRAAGRHLRPTTTPGGCKAAFATPAPPVGTNIEAGRD